MSPARCCAPCVAMLAFAGVLLFADPGHAYCRTTTCDPEPGRADSCVREGSCQTGGIELRWPRACVSFSVQEDGSPLRNITVPDAQRVIGDAFFKWTHVACENGTPGIEVFDRSPVECDAQEYNEGQGNANIWVFRDGPWPYDDGGGTLALTTVTFNVDTGEIYDADVEINSNQNQLTLGDDDVVYDFASIVMHEAGHVLGLSHSNLPRATMYSSYTEGQTFLRKLHPDDEAGICAAIPPNPDGSSASCNPTPRHGFSSQCATAEKGCLTATAGQRSPWAPVGLFVGLTLLLGLRVRRQRRR